MARLIGEESTRIQNACPYAFEEWPGLKAIEGKSSGILPGAFNPFSHRYP